MRKIPGKKCQVHPGQPQHFLPRIHLRGGALAAAQMGPEVSAKPEFEEWCIAQRAPPQVTVTISREQHSYPEAKAHPIHSTGIPTAIQLISGRKP